jgi:hypothetical protein
MDLQRGSRDKLEEIFPAFTSEHSGKSLNHEEMGWGCGEQHYQHNQWLIFIEDRIIDGRKIVLSKHHTQMTP